MSDQDAYNWREAGAFSDVRSQESLNRQMLREAFAEIEQRNRVALDNFDPDNPYEWAEIEVLTSYGEYEAAEPEVADGKRQAMLHDLGLEYQRLEKWHPGYIFEYSYRNGAVHQIRMVDRDFATQIPVHTVLGSNEDGNAIEKIELLSHQQAKDLKTRFQNELEEQRLNARLARESGLDAEMLEQANMSLADKRAIVATYDQIQNEAVIRPDAAVLDHVRHDLVKAMLPGNRLMSFMRRNRLLHAKNAYEASVSELMQRHGPDIELLESEQLRRLRALNEQLHRRKLAAKVGLIAATGAIVGGRATLGARMKRYAHLREQARQISGFSSDDFKDVTQLSQQLLKEEQLARQYIAQLKQ